MLTDTHCHIHEASYPLNAADVLARAHENGVDRMICVGTNQQSSREAVEFAAKYDGVFASVGVHPHDTKDGWGEIAHILKSVRNSRTIPSQNGFAPGLTGALAPGQPWAADVLVQEDASTRSTSVSSQPLHLSPEGLRSSSERRPNAMGEPVAPHKVTRGGNGGAAGDQGRGVEARCNNLVAIGEIGLDYYYGHSPRDTQIEALEAQIELALKYDLPIIFHVRDAFDDFWPVFDNFHGIRGELHSFTDNQANLDQGLQRGLLVGVNGISTFTKDPAQQQMFATIPPKHMLFETDAPFLTPTPLRGTINEPALVRHVADHHAKIRGMTTQEIAAITSANATALFALD